MLETAPLPKSCCKVLASAVSRLTCRDGLTTPMVRKNRLGAQTVRSVAYTTSAAAAQARTRGADEIKDIVIVAIARCKWNVRCGFGRG